MKNIFFCLFLLFSFRASSQDTAANPGILMKIPFLSANSNWLVNNKGHSTAQIHSGYQVLPLGIWFRVKGKLGIEAEVSYSSYEVSYSGFGMQPSASEQQPAISEEVTNNQLQFQWNATYELWQKSKFSQQLFVGYSFMPELWNAHQFTENSGAVAVRVPGWDEVYYRHFWNTTIKQRSVLQYWSLGTQLFFFHENKVKIGVKSSWDFVPPMAFEASYEELVAPEAIGQNTVNRDSNWHYIISFGVDCYIDLFTQNKTRNTKI